MDSAKARGGKTILEIYNLNFKFCFLDGICMGFVRG